MAHFGLLPAMLAGPVLGSCRHGPRTAVPFVRHEEPPERVWERLARRKILFAHQSVGMNILSGVRTLLTEYPEIRLNLERPAAPEGYLASVRIGCHGDPVAKLNGFSAVLKDAPWAGVDIAICKFCYTDISPADDPQRLFGHYRTTMGRLSALHPGIRFVHVTVPLKKRQSGWKTVIKRLLARPLAGVTDNLVRNRYNDLLRQEYGASVFDLAAIESTWPDGRREGIVYREQTGYALVPAYTDNGGHLNALGQRLAAERFLAFLAALP